MKVKRKETGSRRGLAGDPYFEVAEDGETFQITLGWCSLELYPFWIQMLLVPLICLFVLPKPTLVLVIFCHLPTECRTPMAIYSDRKSVV